MDGWCPLYQKFPDPGTAGKIHDANQGRHHQNIKSIVLDISFRSGRLSVSLDWVYTPYIFPST